MTQNDLLVEDLGQLLATGGFFAASYDELFGVLRECSETDFELMSFAWCEIQRRDKPGKMNKAERICEERDLYPVPWLMNARNALSLLDRPTPRNYTQSVYVILRSGYTTGNGYGAYVGVTSKTPEERFKQHTTPSHRLAANGLPENGICLLKSLMHPFIKVPGKLKLQYETAVHLALSLAGPRVTGDIQDDYLKWLPELQPRLMEALNMEALNETS